MPGQTVDYRAILREQDNGRYKVPDFSQVKVTILPNDKTSFVERDDGDDRTILLDEYHVDGKTIWAGYSTRSGTVYLSNVTRR